MNKEVIGVAMANLFQNHEEYGNRALVCELTEFEENGDHNCMACNLARSFYSLKALHENLDHHIQEEYIYRIYLPQIYIICEEFDAILQECNIYCYNRPKQFNAISIIKKLMNFEKHPKRKIFLNHPTYEYVPWDDAITRTPSKAKPREYFSYKDIDKFYSNSKTIKEDSKAISDLFCGVCGLKIILPKISTIIKQLSDMTDELLKLERIKELSKNSRYIGRME